MNGRQSGAVRYLASLSLYYYSPGLPRRSVSSLAFVVPRSFFLSLVFFCLIASLFLCVLSVPSFKFSLPFFSSLTWPSSGPAPFTLSLSLQRIISLVRRRSGSPYRWQDIMHNLFLRIDSRCAFCTHRAHGFAGKPTVIFPIGWVIQRFWDDFPEWHVVTIWKRESRNRKLCLGISSNEIIKYAFPKNLHRRKEHSPFENVYSRHKSRNKII